MTEERSRNTGIEIIGPAPWGAHFCQFYQTKQDLIDILVPYFKAGLENNEFCMWITSDPLSGEEALLALRASVPDLDRFLESGQLEVLPYNEWYTKGGSFDSTRVLNGWVGRLDQALARGFDGLRLTGNTFWLEKEDWEDFTDYEEEVNAVIGKYRMMAICTYCLDKCGSLEVIDVIKNHQFALIRKGNGWDIIESAEHKRMTEALQENNKRLEFALEVTQIGAWDLDLVNHTAWRSPRHDQIFGYQRPLPEWTYEIFLEHLLPEDRGEVDRRFRQAIANRQDWSFECRIRRIDGEIRWIWAHGRSRYNERAEPVRMLGWVQDITERKRAEQALREGEERYRVLVDGASDYAIFMLDPNGYIASWSIGGERLKGYRTEEIMGRHFSIFFAPEDIQRGEPEHQLARAAADGIFEDEGWRVRKDGSRFWADAVITALRDDDGTLRGFAKVTRDVTERKRVEEELRNLSRAVEQSPNTVVITDTHGDIEYVNPKFTQLTGYTLEEALGQNPRILKSGETPREEYERLWATIRSGSEWRGEFHNKKKNGELYWELASISSIRNADGEITHFLAVKEDITERKRAEDELRETRDYLENLFNYANAPIIVWDPSYRITRFNHAFEHSTGYSADEVLGKELHVLFPEASRQESLDQIALASAGEHWESVEIPILCKDGDTRLALWNSANVYAEDGRTLVATIAQGQDITERRRAEEESRETSDYLDNLFNYANAPIIVWDADFRITRFNHAFEHLTGYSASEAIGRELHMLFPEASRQESLSKIGLTLTGEQWESVEIPIMRKDGGVRLALWNSANVYSKDGHALLATIAQGQDITERKQAEGRLGFLTEASTVLASSLNHETTLANVAQLVVPQVADWFIVDILAEDGSLQLQTVAHVDPEKVQWARELRQRYPMDMGAAYGAPNVVRTGRPELYPDIPDSLLQAVARNAEELSLLRNIGYRSLMIVPLQARGRTLGVITLVAAESNRHYGPADLDLAQELARRVAVAIDNSRLYRERIDAEEELRKTSEYLENLFNYANAPIIVWDPDYKITRFNHAFERLTGYTAGEVIGRELEVLFPAESREESLTKIALTLAGQYWESVEIPILRKDGATRWALWNSANLYTEDGKSLLATIAQGQDITDRKNAEQERERLVRQLQVEQARWQTTVESMPDMLTVADADGRAIYVNAAQSRLFGYQVDPNLALDEHPAYYRTYHPDGTLFEPEDLPLQRAALFGEEARDVEVVMRTADGEECFTRWDASPLRDPEGVIIGAVAVGRDVTERRRAEEEIKDLNVALTRRAQEIDAINKELESFSYSVSHDLRAPLRSIDGFSQALLEDYDAKLDAQGKEYLRWVRSATRDMAQLIDDLLTLSRVTRGEMYRERVDLSSLARSIASQLQERQPDRPIEFVIAPGLVVNGDARLIRLSLENLLENAWKFSSKHPQARIEVGSCQCDGEQTYFVRDDGAGFDMTYVDKLFGAFQRLHSPAEFEGTGIGLATVQRIIHRHGGRVWAKGAVEDGATFYFTLSA